MKGPVSRCIRALVVLLAAIAGVGCTEHPASRTPGPLHVVVTVPPLMGLIKPLVPAGSSITMLMAPGRSEHGYEFTPQDIAALGNADVVVYVGAGLEPSVEDFLKKHPSSRRRDVCFQAVSGIAEDAHDHGESHDGHEHRIDPHLWLDAQLCERLVAALEPVLRDSLQNAGESAGASAVQPAAAKLKAEIAAIDSMYRERLAGLKDRTIVTHHNAWQRIADRYNLTVAAVMRDTEGAEMTPQAVAATVEAIKKRGAKAVFVEPQFDQAAARRIADAAGVKIATLDPLGDGDWFKMMRSNLDALVGALGD